MLLKAIPISSDQSTELLKVVDQDFFPFGHNSEVGCIWQL